MVTKIGLFTRGLSIGDITFDLWWPWNVISRSRDFQQIACWKQCMLGIWEQWKHIYEKNHMRARLWWYSIWHCDDLERSNQGHMTFNRLHLGNGTDAKGQMLRGPLRHMVTIYHKRNSLWEYWLKYDVILSKIHVGLCDLESFEWSSEGITPGFSTGEVWMSYMYCVIDTLVSKGSMEVVTRISKVLWCNG